jgi:predicted adenine nucleotide alpha hydrolase (AANH) superfamily ATPase
MGKVLLHICCGICSGYPVEKLRSDGFEVVGFFYNPNIEPREEYDLRLNAATKLAAELKFELITGAYEPGTWHSRVQGLAQEKEGGKRCGVCFRMRLERTCAKARELRCGNFTSTLTVSPHKDARLIHEIGASLGSGFLAYDFKKEDGFKKSSGFAREHDLYRQHYCGCVFSKAGR